MRNLIIILLLITLASCKTKQITTVKTEYIKDTIFTEKIVKINVPIINTIEIESPCDSITGKLKPFKQVIKSGKVNVRIESKDGLLTAMVNIDSIKQVALKEYVAHTSDKTEFKEVIITRYKNPKFFWLILMLTVLMIICF
jgi:hypothetical protein